jgi:hypothetical protein
VVLFEGPNPPGLSWRKLFVFNIVDSELDAKMSF